MLKVKKHNFSGDHNGYFVYDAFMTYWEYIEQPMIEITPVVNRLMNQGYAVAEIMDTLDSLVERGFLKYEGRDPIDIPERGGLCHAMYYGPVFEEGYEPGAVIREGDGKDMVDAE